MNQMKENNDQRTILKMEKAITSQMEKLIPEMQQMAKDFGIAGDKSPYRNVLNVAVDPTSDVEVTKNYILYQLGRDQKSPWRNTNSQGEKLGLALVNAIKNLEVKAKQVVEKMGKEPEKAKELLQRVHRRLMQLYLGNLVRYQVYLTFEAENSRNRER